MTKMQYRTKYHIPQQENTAFTITITLSIECIRRVVVVSGS